MGYTGAMHISSLVARPLLAGMFVYGGLDAFRNPAGKVPRAEKVAPDIAGLVGIDADTEQLVQFNGAVQVAAGTTLALGVLPRLSARLIAWSAHDSRPSTTPKCSRNCCTTSTRSSTRRRPGSPCSRRPCARCSR